LLSEENFDAGINLEQPLRGCNSTTLHVSALVSCRETVLCGNHVACPYDGNRARVFAGERGVYPVLKDLFWVLK